MTKNKIYIYVDPLNEKIHFLRYFGELIYTKRSGVTHTDEFYFFETNITLPKTLTPEDLETNRTSTNANNHYITLWKQAIKLEAIQLNQLIALENISFDVLKDNLAFLKRNNKFKYWYYWCIFKENVDMNDLLIFSPRVVSTKYYKIKYWLYICFSILKLIMNIVRHIGIFFKDLFVFNVEYQKNLQKAEKALIDKINARKDFLYSYGISEEEKKKELEKKQEEFNNAKKIYAEQNKNVITVVVSLLAIALTIFGSLINSYIKDSEIQRLKNKYETTIQK